MKYWKVKDGTIPQSQVFMYTPTIDYPGTKTFVYLEKASAPTYTMPQFSIVIEISKEEYDLYKKFNIEVGDNDPSTGLPWANASTKQNWITNKLWQFGVKDRADKGQEVENAIELNDAIKSYVNELWRGINFETFGILGELAKNPTDITIDRRFNDKMKEWKAYNGLISNIESFERSLAIATNSDTTHPIDPRNESVFVGVLTQIATEEKPLWLEITKILKVEETYEPEMVKNEYIKLQQAVHSHLHSDPTIDPAITSGTETLAHELGGATPSGK